MNRLIIFRVRRKDTGTVAGYEMLFSTQLDNSEYEWAQSVNRVDWTSGTMYGKGYIREQFTGLTDKDGREIYEGDILRTTDVPELPPKIRVATYLAPSFYLQKKLGDTVDVESFSTPVIEEEVIGNIYENSELLP